MPAVPDLSLVRVLIIEDEFLIALDLEQTLRCLGFTAVRSTGTVAQAVAVASSWRPNLITADLRLPDGSGREAVHRIRAQPDAGEVATIFITANPELLADEPGAVTLGKPFSEPALCHAIEMALTGAAGGEQPRASAKPGSPDERSAR
jgi:CheY-like chemotaxis protein